MRQIVMSREEKYIELTFNFDTPVIVPEKTDVLCKLALLGYKSPISLHCNITENKKADLTMYMSTQVKEPKISNCMRVVERLKLFYFSAKNKEKYFDANDYLYITVKSLAGCCITIRPEHCLGAGE